MKRALVTGSTGFIGKHLVRVLFEQGYEVVCLVRETSSRQSLLPFQPEFRVGDMSDFRSLRQAVRDVDTVFHLAGLTKSHRVSDLMKANQHGASLVAQACASQSNPPTLMYVSSLAAAGPSCGIGARVESDSLEPVSHYGKSKLAGEFAVREFSDHCPTTIIRPPIVFGEGDKDVLNLFQGIARLGIHVIPSLYDSFFSAIHARDLCFALLSAAESGKRLVRSDDSEGTYFVADEQVVTYAGLGQIIGSALGREKVINVRIPHPVLCTLAAISEMVGFLKGKAGIINLDKAREAKAGSWVCSPQKLKSEVGFSCVHSLETRIRQTACWYEQKGWIPSRQNVLQTSC
ncbi:MAG: NAD-dependent epimerase/dehydratase family protein [Rubripirellula sp.]